MRLTETEEARQYLLLVTAAAVRARLKSPDNLDYAIDRLQRVVDHADEEGQSEIATIARGELDVAKRVKEEIASQQT